MSSSVYSSVREMSREGSGIRYVNGDSAMVADPGAVVDRFRADKRVAQPGTDDYARFDTYSLPELELPGHGDEYDSCGEGRPRFCANCGSTHTVGRTCKRARCPRCGKAWDRERSTAITSKLEATRRWFEASGEGWQGYKFHHISISPPDGYEMYTSEALDRTFDLIKEVLSETGVETGVLFYHPFRGEDGDDKGFWKNLLFSGQDWSETREQLSHEPHFHAVVVAKWVPGGQLTKAIERKTGWVIERITKGDSNVSIYDKYDLARVVTYCLSHTGLGESASGRTDAKYRYFGRVANLTADDHIKREMDAAVRSVVPTTLGLSWSSVACERESDEGTLADDHLVASTAVNHGARMTAVDGEGEDIGIPSDSDADAPGGKCAGRLLRIERAPSFLADPEWRDAAPNVDDLEATYLEWRGKDPPD